jgi:hypothetical protein
MGQNFCTNCGKILTDGAKFCEHCGAPADPVSPVQKSGPGTNPPSNTGGGQKIPVKIIAGVIIVLIIMAVAALVLLPALSGGLPPGLTGPTPVPTPVQTSVAQPVATVETIMPTPTPDLFPDAFRLGEKMPFGSGEVASEGTVYRYWINDTYQWHNDMDNKYYPQVPSAGNKYLFVFVYMENVGSTRVWLPHAGTVSVWNNGNTYYEDPEHYKPDKATDRDATAIEVREIQYFHKMNGDEYVEDFGFSHGAELGYIYPGKSNAVDGYIIYEVPQSLVPEETYVSIAFNGDDHGVWRLA